jgi:enoyl-CoA hydratase
MPETLIGLCPDVAGLHLLARAPGELGVHAAMTGASFGSGDAVEMGFADAVVPDERLADLIDLMQKADPDSVLTQLHEPDAGMPPTLLTEHAWVSACYTDGDAPEILEALRTHPARKARDAANMLARVSPTAATVTLEAIRRAREFASMKDCLVQDFRVNSRFLAHPDLVEGIRARVIDRDRSPAWSPASLADVKAEQIAAFFAPLSDPIEELVPDALIS